MPDLYNNLLPQRSLSPAAAITDNTAQVGQIIDTLGYERALYVISLGSLVDADATFTVLIEDGDNAALSDNAGVLDANMTEDEANVGFDFADDNTERRIEVRPVKRYLRMTITPVGNTGNAFISCSCILGNAMHAPVTAQAT